jgi:hypothetical protein
MDIIESADHAAKQSDRWLLIVTLIIMGLLIVAIWRWMVNDREKISDRLTAITDRHIESQERVIEVVANNTNTMEKVITVIDYCRSKNHHTNG